MSVVICTYNRAELLANGLQTLCEQTLPMSDYEVLVVDNNSQDNTRAVTEDYCRRYPNIRYFFETKQGLSYARNRGWREAKGAYVAYIDDECKVPSQWLTVAMEIIDRLSPVAFGGPYFAYHNSSLPRWWQESYESFELSDTARPLEPEENLRGGNIFFKRKLLERIGGFNVELGMSGQNIGYGEEAEVQKRMRIVIPGGIIFYDPRLYIYHLVRSEKMEWLYILCSRFAAGRHIYTVFGNKTLWYVRLLKPLLLAQALLTIFKFLVDILFSLFWRDRKRYPYMQNYLYENTFEYMRTLGFIFERIIHKI